MPELVLPSKPLVEALLEIRWKLSVEPSGIRHDRHGRLAVGRLYERIQAQYGHYEELPSAQLPDELVAHQVQHRFRCAPEGWPLVQIGPGIMTFNQTAEYTTFSEFRKGALDVLNHLLDVYGADFKPEGFLLRYINAYPFDYANHDVVRFLADRMGIVITPHSTFLAGASPAFPNDFKLALAYPYVEPRGDLRIEIGAGRKQTEPVLLWDFVFASIEEAAAAAHADADAWLRGAHGHIERCFLGMIDGGLREEFAREP